MNSLYEQHMAFGSVIDVLEAVGATYAIWGGVAVSAYGEPRFTHDMDILLDGASLLIPIFVKRLQEAHFFVDPITIREICHSGGFANVIHEPYQIKVDLYVPHEPLLRAMISSRVYLPFDEMRRAAYVTAESVIIAKLVAYQDSQSTRHLDDVGAIVRIQQSNLDLHHIEPVATKLGLFAIWRQVFDKNKLSSSS